VDNMRAPVRYKGSLLSWCILFFDTV
jgi:hypothetical protein